jgi:hypothetical protein
VILFVSAVLLVAPASGATRPGVQLSVSPARLALVAPASRRIKVRNDGAQRIVVDVTHRTAEWLLVRPAHLRLDPGRSALLTLRATRSRHAEPGDHRALVLFTTRPLLRERVNVRARLGVRLVVTMPGRVVRTASLGAIRVQRNGKARLLVVATRNDGNVTVRPVLTARLIRRGRALAQLHARNAPMLRPGAGRNVKLRYGGRVRGSVTVVVRARLGGGAPPVERRYRLRL